MGSNPQPVLRLDRPRLDFAGGVESTYDAASDPASRPGRIVVQVSGNIMLKTLQLDLRAGVGRVDATGAVSYDESSPLEAK